MYNIKNTCDFSRRRFGEKRALAHMEKIQWIKQIDGADNIELIGVLGWNLIAKKGEFSINDNVVFFEIDSKLPERDWSEFLKNKNYKIKTLKLNKFNVISQGLALPLSAFENEKYYNDLINKNVGDDLTDIIGVKYSVQEDNIRKSDDINKIKYNNMIQRNKKLFSKKFFSWLIKKNIGKKILFVFLGNKKDKPKMFPEWITKTDEIRCENIPQILECKDTLICSEKIDGTSGTFFVDYVKSKKGDFGVCSRNIRQLNEKQECYHTCGNVYWETVGKYDIENALKDMSKKYNHKRVVLQGEIFGEGLQGNPYKLNERRFCAFNLIFDGERLNSITAKEILSKYNIPFVPIVDISYKLPNTMEELKLQADGFSVINPDVKREGFVYRSYDGIKSFKNVSREYLVKHS